MATTLVLFPNAPASANSAGSSFYTPSSTNETLGYDRIIRLAHSSSEDGDLIGTFESSHLDGTAASFAIRKSTDDGASWSTISSVADPLTSSGHPSNQMWQPFLFEFPQALGAYPAGTLLLVGNAVASTGTNFLEWRSTNDGASWTFVSDFQTADAYGSGSGIWEPFLGLDSSGNLICYFSDERENGTWSQFLGHIVSTDGGASWSANANGSTRVSPGEVKDVASTAQSDRPGMATVAVTGSHLYVMAYEICGAYGCVARYKTSATGDTWGGGATDLGTTAQTSDGRVLYHSPYIAWSPGGGPNGELLLAGQIESAGESQQVLFVNTANGSGSWSWTAAPLAASGSSTTCMDNNAGMIDYSPDLLVSPSGQSVRYTAPSAIGPTGCEEVTGQANAGVLPLSADFSGGDSGWIDYGGCWSTSGDVYSETCGGNGGNKALAGSTGWTDYTVQGDVRIDSGTQVGLVVRATNPSVGTDSLNGYFIGLVTPGSLFMGRENGSWTLLHSVSIVGGVSLGTWYHLVVQAVGCSFTVSAVPVGSTAPPTAFTYTDSGCAFTNGAVGVRDMGGTASWRALTATPSGTTSTATAPYYAPFASGSATSWTTYGGSWTVTGSSGTYSDTAGGAGDKAVAGSSSWGNYAATADVQLGTGTGTTPNAGLVVRVSNPGVGADSLDGYFAGVTSSTLLLGRESYGWTPLASVALPVPLTANAWYHLTVQVVGCTITVTGVPSAGGSQVGVSYTDSGCSFITGVVGVRTFNSAATWKYVAVTPL